MIQAQAADVASKLARPSPAANDEDNKGSTKEIRDDNEDSAKEVGEDLAKDSRACSSGEKVSEGDESDVQLTLLPPMANVSLPLTPGRGVNTP
ncbi:uncharacterized protein A4U43_C09F7630 [Asparagus officinalis]|uniref:Uncharacterized protein n=1 Tax=Asparagus officinalis TaxID=4686 RepID=A0A5P1E5Y8_ASPOF|nr:uncharacterized protein A4U43_C09F7630 [Asparagus officinalis]